MPAHDEPRLSSPRWLLVVGAVLALPFGARCTEPTLTGTGNNLNLNNTAPVARAGLDGEAPLGVDLALTGTASYDPDGDEISYFWAVDRAPEGSALAVTENPFSMNGSRNAGITGVVPDVEGLFIFSLFVEDPSGLVSARDYVVFTVRSTLQRPVANAGPNQTTLEGTEVCLDGSASWDPSGRAIEYDWTVVATPEASAITTASLTDVAAVQSCFTPDAPGTFTIALVVDNQLAISDPDFVFVATGSTNQGPTADATILSAFSCDFVQLSAANSTDPEGDTLEYAWDILLVPLGSQVPLGQAGFDDASAVSPSFYADSEGVYTMQLVVNDGEAFSTPVILELNVTEKETNGAPVVVVSPDAYFYAPSPVCSTNSYGQCVNCPNCPGQSLAVNASGTTDPDGDPLNITWSIESGPSGASVSQETGTETTLNVPGPPGSCTATMNSYTIQVRATATDCSGDSSSRLITVLYECG